MRNKDVNITLAMNAFLQEVIRIRQRGFKTDEIHSFLLRTLIHPNSLRRYLHFNPNRYTRNLVYKDSDFELLVLCWNSGQAAPIHGHEGERCWSRVERGELQFTNYHEISQSPLVLEKSAPSRNGQRGHLDGPADIHSVENVKASGEPAVSLHLYSEPYDECDIYDLIRGEKRRVHLSYDTIQGELVST